MEKIHQRGVHRARKCLKDSDNQKITDYFTFRTPGVISVEWFVPSKDTAGKQVKTFVKSKRCSGYLSFFTRTWKSLALQDPTCRSLPF